MSAALYLIPVTLGDTPIDQVLPSYNRDIILSIKHFIVEEERTARRFLKSVCRDIDIDSLTFYPMGKHSDEHQFRSYLRPITEGLSVGIISEAGCPAIADPGADVVAIAQKLNIRVIPLVGPSSILLALMSSGFNGQSFAFNGYLPIQPAQRSSLIKRLEARAYAEHQTQIFIETPFRNERIINDLTSICRPQTLLCIAAGLTTAEEYVRTLPIQQWKKTKLPDLRKTPSIFLISAP